VERGADRAGAYCGRELLGLSLPRRPSAIGGGENACGRAAAGAGFSARGERTAKMIRTRLTWVIVGAVAALALVAGMDALRSSDSETTAAATTAAAAAASTTTEGATGFQSVWNVPYRFRGTKPERLRKGGRARVIVWSPSRSL
jgi:hypothetical protein